MRIYKKTRKYSLVGTEKRNIRVSNSLLEVMKNPVLLVSPDNTWKSPKASGNEILLSECNSKMRELGKRLDKKTASYGKSTILSCPFAGSCVRFCYQNLNSYPASMRLHAHNYLMVWGKSKDTIKTAIKAALKTLKTVEVVRLNDNGDFVSIDEILAWIEVAVLYPDIIFYGYTKNTPHLYKARKLGHFPSNFRVSISDLNENDPTSLQYANKIRSEFPEIRTCRIIDSPERDRIYQDLPWNDGDYMAYSYNSDFKIAIHVGQQQRQFCTENELTINDKYAHGHDENGIAYC